MDEVVVTATRSPGGVRADLLGGAASVVTPQQMDERQVRTVSDVLRDIPGVAVNRAGPAGNITQVRVRGGESNQTLVFIDGIEAGDPFQGEFDFATLIADDVARIEVLRGPQSALYGSQAIDGVIHYMTANGAEAPGVRGRIEGGSFSTFNGAARAAGVSGPLDYALSAAYSTTDGTPGARGGTRDIGAQTATTAGKLTWTASDNLTIRATGRYSRTKADVTGQDFDFPPTPTYGMAVDGTDRYRTRTILGLVEGELSLLDDRWVTTLGVQGNSTRRRNANAGGVFSGSNGERVKASLVSTLNFGEGRAQQRATLALDSKRETYRNIPIGAALPMNAERKLETRGYVAEYGLTLDDRLGVGAAVRFDDNERFGDATTWRVQASYSFEGGFRLRAAAGTGMTAPTNFELFGFDPGSFIGNPDLKPETSRGWEAGVDYRVDRVELGLTYFDARLKDEIFTAFTPSFQSTPRNRTERSTRRGVEATAAADLGDGWRIDAAYTHLRAREGAGLEEVRRPRDTASVNLAWRGDRAGAVLTVRYNGQAKDFDFTNPFGGTVRHDMKAFTLVNLAGDWRVREGVTVFGRIENLFDEDYEEVFTFTSSGRAAYVGVKAGF